MAKNQTQKEKLLTKNKWKKENQKKKIIKKGIKKRKLKQSKEKYQQTLEIIFVKNKSQKDTNWNEIFQKIKQKYQNFVARLAYFNIDQDDIQCGNFILQTNDVQETKKIEKKDIWTHLSQFKWKGKYRVVLLFDVKDLSFENDAIKRIFQKRVNILRFEQSQQQDDFDNKAKGLNEFLYEVISQCNEKNFENQFTKYIFQKLEKKIQIRQPKPKMWYGNLKKGLWFSNTNYIRVIQINKDEYTCVDKNKFQLKLKKKDLLKYQSAQQYTKQIPLTHLELVQKLLDCRQSILKVTYNQKYTTDQFKKKLQNEKDLQQIQKDENWLKEMIKGKACEIICFLQQNQVFLGKILVKNIQSNIIQQIDLRSIEELVVNQVRYFLKESKLENLNQEIKIEDWFALDEYFTIKDLVDEKIVVQNDQGEEKYLRKDFIEQECFSADNFLKKKNTNLRDIVDILKNMHQQIFTIEYKTKREFNESFQKLKEISHEAFKDQKRLRKICKNITFKNMQTSIAKQVKIDTTLSYSIIYDFILKKEIKIDHRSIRAIIYNNTRYVKS